jgi:hypothetical protein
LTVEPDARWLPRLYPGAGQLAQLIAKRADEHHLSIESISTLAPTLEDVFLSITAASRT